MNFKIESATVSNAIILTIVTTCIIYSILYSLKPSYLIDNNKNFKKFLAIIYSYIFATIFSIFITFVSLYTDKQFAKIKNN